jgi:hypothetical protein
MRLVWLAVVAVCGAVAVAFAAAGPPATPDANQDCELFGRQLQAAFTPAEPPAPRLRFAWQDCDPSPEPKILTWRIENFLSRDLRIAKAVFHYEYPRLDRVALVLSRRIEIADAQTGYAEFFVEATAVAAYLARDDDPAKFVVAIDGSELTVRSGYKLWRWDIGLTFRGPLVLQGDAVRYELHALKLGGWNLPGFIRRWVEKSINPVFRLDLAPWALQATEIHVSDEPDGVLLTAKERHASP